MDFKKFARNLSSTEKLEFAALKMESDKADQLRAQWEAIENKNTEKLTLLVNNVETFKKRTNTRVFKTKLGISRLIGSDSGQMGLFVGSFCAVALVTWLGRTQNISNVVMLGATSVATIGAVGTLLDWFSLGQTAQQYSKNNQISSRKEVFDSIKNLNSNNKELNACVEQLYALGADEEIPAPFWSQSNKLLKEITQAHVKYTTQQREVKNQLENISERDPQADQSVDSLTSFAARHNVFVAVKSESEEPKIRTQPLTSKNQTIKI